MSNKNEANYENYKSERDIEVARIAYIGAAIATVADAIAVIGDGISTYAAKLALDALIEDYAESQATSSSSSTNGTETASTSSTSSTQTSSQNNKKASSNSAASRYTGKLKREDFLSSNRKSKKSPFTNHEFDELKGQIDHYINELIDIRDSLNNK